MRAEYDSQADALAITLVEVKRADHGDQVHERSVVAVVDGRAVDVEVLYPDMGLEAPLLAAAQRYDLDHEALVAAARAAVAAPDRPVVLDVGARVAV